MLAYVRKAIMAAASAGVATFVANYPDGLTANEIGGIVGAMVAAGILVYSVPNKGQNTEV